MTKPDILQMGTLPERDETPLNDEFSVHRYFEMDDTSAWLAEHGEKIKAIVTRGDLGANRDLINACPNLGIIVIYGVGYDAIDIDLCRERGIKVANTPDVLTNDVADFAIAMMLAQSRGIIGGSDWVQSGNWAANGMYPLTQRVHGKRAGILGLGRIGYAIAKRLAAFDMDISYSSTAAKTLEQDWTFIADPVELAKQSDFLFVALAASAETKHIVGPEVIKALGANGMIINISRAANIDEDALIKALANKELGAAALDVFDNEPNIDPRLLELDNVLLQPHQASGTHETRAHMGQLMRDNLTAFFAGKPLLTMVV